MYDSDIAFNISGVLDELYVNSKVLSWLSLTLWPVHHAKAGLTTLPLLDFFKLSSSKTTPVDVHAEI